MSLEYPGSDSVNKGELRGFPPNSQSLKGSRVCNANMDGRDVVCVMPTGLRLSHLRSRSS